MLAQPCVTAYLPTREIINQILMDMIKVGSRTSAGQNERPPRTMPSLTAQQQSLLLASLEEEYDTWF